MRSKEFIVEKMKKNVINPEHSRALAGITTYPDQNMYHGSGYHHSRYLLAVASAGAGDTPDSHMPDENWAGGDPMYHPYSKAEEEMLDRTAKHVGDTSAKKWGSGKSKEPKTNHTTSPVANWMKK